MAKFFFILILTVVLGAISMSPKSGHADNELRAPISSFEIESPSRDVLDQIAHQFEIVSRQPHRVEVLVPQDQIAKFLRIAPNATLLDEDISETVRRRRDRYSHDFSGASVRYHNFDEIQTWMINLAQQHPQQVQIVPYGITQDSRPLNALHLSKNVNLASSKPKLMLTSATHGDELITVEVTMALAQKLLDGYGLDQRLTQLIDNHEIYFIPVVNPDGFVRADRYEHGVDPNRSYPYPGAPGRRPTPSIQSLIQFFQSHAISGSIDFHAYGELIMYPWAYTKNPVDSLSLQRFDSIARTMASNNGYTNGSIANVIYISPGSSADFYFWKNKSLSFGIEIGQDKVPPPTQFARYIDSQIESTWQFIDSF